MSDRPHVRADIGRRPARDRPQPVPTIVLALKAAGWTIAFTGCPEVAGGLEAILHGWGVQRVVSSAPRKLHAHVTRTASGYRWRSQRMPKPAVWIKHPPVSIMEAVWDVHDVFFDWWLKKNPRHLCLH